MKRQSGIALCIALSASVAITAGSCKSKKPKPQTTSADVSGASSELRELVKDNVEDEVKREKLFYLLDEADRSTTDFKQAFLDTRLIWENDPQVSREDAEKAWADYALTRIGFIRNIVKLRLEMRSLVTEEEWNKIFVDSEEDKEAALAEPKESTPPAADEEAAPAGDNDGVEEISSTETSALKKENAPC